MITGFRRRHLHPQAPGLLRPLQLAAKSEERYVGHLRRSGCAASPVRVRPRRVPSRRCRRNGRKREEFTADLRLVAKRTLDWADYAIFALRYLRGAEWPLCCCKPLALVHDNQDTLPSKARTACAKGVWGYWTATAGCKASGTPGSTVSLALAKTRDKVPEAFTGRSNA